MGLEQLVYVSRRTNGLSPAALSHIVADSGRRNATRGISGVLLCAGTHVMQLLEGNPADVDALFDRIARDPRHDEVQAVLRKSVRRRLFPEWGMAMADLERKFALDRHRLSRLLDDVRDAADTGMHSVEARVLLHDFRQQLAL